MRWPRRPGLPHLIVTDAWAPQVNGVVRTLEATVAGLRGRGHDVSLLTPEGRRTLPCPTYPEIRLALTRPGEVRRLLAGLRPSSVHIATEGPLGLAARRACMAAGRPFFTSFHTRFADYARARLGIPTAWGWRFLRWFHGPAAFTLAATPGLEAELAARGIGPVRRWTRGADLSLFRPGLPQHPELASLPRPRLLCVGRVAIEKGVERFLGLATAGSRVVVGEGPEREALARAFPQARFLGARFGDELASLYASADCLVFPSTTDTFGLVMIEALACGTPVAALPVPGPLDVLAEGGGAMDHDLARAVEQALAIPRPEAARAGARFGWGMALDQYEAAARAIS